VECKELKKQLANSGLPGKLLSNRCMCVLLRCYNVLTVMVITDSTKYFAFSFTIFIHLCTFSPRAGSGSTAPLIHLLISALYIYHLLVTLCASPLILLLHVFLYFSTPLPLHFQVGGRKRQPNLGFFFTCFSLFYVIVFLYF